MQIWTLACRSQCNGLPHDLSTLILEKLMESYNTFLAQNDGLHMLLSMRRISKSWRAAISEYGGQVSLKARKQTNLSRLIKLLPRVSKLRIRPESAQCVRPLSAYTSLSSLVYSQYKIRGSDEADLILDLGTLPSGLIDLALSGCHIAPASFSDLKCVCLTSLKLSVVSNPPGELCELLQRVPRLQVSLMAGTSPKVVFYAAPICC